MRVLSLIVLLGGCASSSPELWIKTDGTAVVPDQFRFDEKVCQDERQKAEAAKSWQLHQVGSASYFYPSGNSLDAVAAAYSDCMTQHGYARAP